MKFLYVLGLEHSGTTLISHLLGQHERFLAVGEVAAFFSPTHMQSYLRKWGDYDDARMCSCSEQWQDCDFWGNLIDLAGHKSSDGLLKKYKLLFDYCNQKYVADKVLVDSSKSLSTLTLLLENAEYLGISRDDIFVVYAVKDVRNFATSIAAKEGEKRSIVATYRSFNWWLGENKAALNYLRQSKVNFELYFYDAFAQSANSSQGDDDLSELLSPYFSALGYQSVEFSTVAHSQSHIAMGNKNFIMRKHEGISYDDRWTKNVISRLVYVLHWKACALNRFFYRSSAHCPAKSD